MDDIQLIEYLRGTLNTEQQEKVRLWIEEHPDHKRYFESIRAIWESRHQLRYKPATESAWNRLVQRRDLQLRKQRDRRRMLVAAVIPLLISFIWIFSPRWNNDLTFERGAESELSKIELPDGSTVWLNRHSTLSFADDFGASNRKVQLSGEAFFDVARDETSPFIIQTQHTSTTVLGTSFNVMAYRDSTKSRVDVASGRVKVQSNTNANIHTLLTKHMAARYDPGSDEITTLPDVDQNRFAWRTRELIFKDAGINEIQSLVKKVYDVELIFSEDQNCIRLNASFSNEPLVNILSTLESLYDLRYREVSANRYTFEGGCL